MLLSASSAEELLRLRYSHLYPLCAEMHLILLGHTETKDGGWGGVGGTVM